EPVKRALVMEFGREATDLAHAIKHLTVPLTGPRPMDEAISTAGGLRFEALDSGLMLRDRPGVFAAGEMLDWEAPTGGYLLTACIATGFWAGQHAARYALAQDTPPPV
ncbi:NAD(P)/FAD-dependent oxidoreductase, partial [Roseovarius sp.]|uniref:NAD(P)/FAD-dependent oxidoreductase n=1 Tax=Roseovarius sp. TaxID=1486281 RepID=UPI0035691D0A